MDQLAPQDAQFLYMESEHNLTHVTTISTFDPSTVPDGKTVRFKDIIAHIEARLVAIPMLKRRLLRVPLELDYPYWVDDEFFDMEYHVRHGRLPHPGDWRQFCIHMARYHSRPLDMRKPLWEVYVVEGLDHVEGLASGSYAIAIKVHHAAVDGTSMVRFFSALLDMDNLGTPAVPFEAVTPPPSPTPSVFDMARRATLNNLRSPLRITDALVRVAPGLYGAAQKAFEKPERSKQVVPDTRFNVDVSPHKMFDATVFPLEDLKSARSLAPGSTINDVVLAVCGGGLRRYLEHHDELPKESLVAWCPINARPRGTGEPDAPGNNITAMTAPIGTDIADPAERLTRIHAFTHRSKAAKAGISARLMTDITKHAPAATQILASRLVLRTGLAQKLCNLFVSNVPGPQGQMYMNGARQVGTYGMAPLADGMGLFIATPSYNGVMSFAVTSAREILPDIRFFIECLEASMAELSTAAKAAA